jgi:predicted phosphodiesterase
MVSTHRVAALYDVHGNLPALHAVIADPRFQAADLVVCGGDVVLGPEPAEVLSLLHGMGSRVLYIGGNCERDVVERSSAEAAWCADRLGAELVDEIGSWDATAELDVEGIGRLLFCHATPRSKDEIITRVTPVADVLDAYAGHTGVVVVGHTHVQYERLLQRLHLVNAGSVGVPYGGERGAQWVLLGPGVELVHTPYEIDAALIRMAATGFPGFEEWVRPGVRGEVGVEDATAYFEGRRGA